MEQTKDWHGNDSEEANNVMHFESRAGYWFIIDVSPEMFQHDLDKKELTYFEQSLKACISILEKKLMWNRDHYMGVMLYNVSKDWDKALDRQYTRTVRELTEISKSMLLELIYMIEHKNQVENYQEPSLDFPRDECLPEALEVAHRSFNAVKVSMPDKQVFLLTHQDNPLSENPELRHKMHLLAEKFKIFNIKLSIVGLGKEWKHSLFYKDVEMLASGADHNDDDDEKRMLVDNLEFKVMFPARTSRHLKWKIGPEVEIPVGVVSFSSRTRYFTTAKMAEDTNEILQAQRRWETFGKDPDDEESDEEENLDLACGNLKNCVIFDEKFITFEPQEIKSIRSAFPKGINLLGFKPISLNSMVYHISGVRLIVIDETAAHEANKSLFASFLKKCEEKKIMAVCTVASDSRLYFVHLIPSMQFGGFYLFKLPFEEQVRQLEEHIAIRDESNNQSISIEEGTKLMRAITKKFRMQWNPLNYRNPRFNHESAYIRALALDVEFCEPKDTTKPNKELMDARMGDLIESFERNFGIIGVPRKRKSAWSDSPSEKVVKKRGRK